VGLAIVWPEGRSVIALIVFRLGTALAAIELAVLGWTAFEWGSALNVAIVIMGGFIILQTGVVYVWNKGADRPSTEALTVNAYVDCAKLAITTQGVVLGLISFNGQSLSDVTLKVGAVSLAAGVLIATVLYLLVARTPPTNDKQERAAAYIVTLLLWALGFGLICVVAGNWNTI
jgi:hypothetical protein